MIKKLDSIYEFLQSNRQYNFELQNKFYKSIIYRHNNTEDKVLSLLYQIANTQSQPKIDKLAKFYQLIHEDIDSLKSFSSFVIKISMGKEPSYKNLFEGLKNCDGWGNKTSALFLKSVFCMHNGISENSLEFWQDTPRKIDKNDRLFIPVDTVIIEIFKRLGFNKCTFDGINNFIASYYQGESIEVWDDLWFWGFITQRVSDGQRIIEWNPNKYWSMENSNKNEIAIAAIKAKSENFINLLNK
jgi:hypothetical protein